MRTLCASTLTFECVVIGLAGLVAMRMTDLSNGVIWAVSGTGMLLCLALCGMLTRPGAVPLGWALQAALVAAGFVIPAMFLLGAAFAGLWWASVHYGRLIDRLKAARAATAEPSPGTL